jgi:acyl-CoA thioester hydrolase
VPLEKFPVALELPVLWADQDLFGHVNNTVYLKWFESARVRYWDDSQMRIFMEPKNWGPILASMSCDFLKQVNYPDQIQTAVRMMELGRSSMILEHSIFSAANDSVVAQGRSVIVLFDYTNQKPQRIDDEIRQSIAQFEGRSFDG